MDTQLTPVFHENTTKGDAVITYKPRKQMAGEKQPTIEQTSRFSAKTKEGQDVEFEAQLRFFVSPKGDVRISAPGGEGRIEGPGRDPSGDRRGPPDPKEPRGRGSRTEMGQPPAEESRSHSREFRRDPELDRGYPRAPPDDCPISQFVPDPCRAINDLGKSIRGWLDGVWPDRGCPPPPPPREVVASAPALESDSMNKQDQFDV